MGECGRHTANFFKAFIGTNVAYNNCEERLSSRDDFVPKQICYLNNFIQQNRKEEKTVDVNINNIKEEKIELNPCAVSSQLLKKSKEKKFNLLLIATSLDEHEIAQKLQDNLRPDSYSMLPIALDITDEDEFNSLKRKLSNMDKESLIAAIQNCTGNFLDSARNDLQERNEKYWKRRNSNNEAARRSREAKRARFSWIQKRSKELEVENENLRKELKFLEEKVSALNNV